MEFDSPDVEKDFPGLYSSEAGCRNIDSDFSDDSHEKSFKSDLIGKKKDKKDSKKDRGYAALEGESSPDEGDSKSPSKSRKTKAFKFPVKKSEKREKSRDKEATKEKELDKDKKKDKEKKEKSKQKERRKGKDDSLESEEHAVFGVPLSLAVERLGCLDGVGIPLPVRHCIDCIQASGLSMEGLYKSDKTAAVKTKLQSLKKMYNAREPIVIADLDISLAAQLLISYLKQLPEPILTNELLTRFEEAGAIQNVATREADLIKLLTQLPLCNRILLAWLILHFDYVTQHEKQNKINAQSIAMTFSPVLQMSHRLLTAFLCHCKALFTNTIIHRYIPPLAPGSVFPETTPQLAVELKKQEALLAQMHRDMSEGFVSKKREEQLWEVQRVVTQLKRKLRSLQKTSEANQMQRSVDEEHQEDVWKKREDVREEPGSDKSLPKPTSNLESPDAIKGLDLTPAKLEAGPSRKGSTTEVPVVDPSSLKLKSEINSPSLEGMVKSTVESSIAKSSVKSAVVVAQHSIEAKENVIVPPGVKEECMHNAVETVEQITDKSDTNKTCSSPPPSPPSSGVIHDYQEVPDKTWEELKLQMEHVELLALQKSLQGRIDHERRLAERFRTLIENYRGFIDSDSEDSSTNSTPAYLSPESESKIQHLMEENLLLTQKKDELVRRIMEERESCIRLKVLINSITEAERQKNILLVRMA